MLVARRDPFHPGAHDTLLPEGGAAAHAVGVLPRLARTMSVLQMVGTLLAVPLGIASFYSMYRANFSVETSCQNLRANIVTMLDKSVDVRTRHMLVRRDVLAFEQRCGSVDPDATAAFKALLAQDTAPVAAAPVRRVEAKPAEGARKVELRGETKTETKTEAEAKSEAKSEAKVETKTVQREAAVSDAAWLAAVRGALTTHAAEPVQIDETAETAPAKPALAVVPPIPQPIAHDVPVIVQVPAPLPVGLPAPLPAATASAPVVRHEPVAAVAAPVPGMQPAWNVPPVPAVAADIDHPVPPAYIPVIAPVAGETGTTAPHEPSRLGGLIAQIPFIGSMIQRK
jgi:hypothetical protein